MLFRYLNSWFTPQPLKQTERVIGEYTHKKAIPQIGYIHWRFFDSQKAVPHPPLVLCAYGDNCKRNGKTTVQLMCKVSSLGQDPPAY